MLASVGYGKPYTAEKLFVEKDLHFANFVQSQDMNKTRFLRNRGDASYQKFIAPKDTIYAK